MQSKYICKEGFKTCEGKIEKFDGRKTFGLGQIEVKDICLSNLCYTMKVKTM